jgi:hypothetical protein
MGFNESMRRREDIEWLLRINRAGVLLLWVDAPVTVVDSRRAIARGSAAASSVTEADVVRWARLALGDNAVWQQNFLLTNGLKDVVWSDGRAAAWRFFARALRLRRAVQVPVLMQALGLLILPWPKLMPFRSRVVRTLRRPAVPSDSGG